MYNIIQVTSKINSLFIYLQWADNTIELLEFDHNGRSVVSYYESEGQVFSTNIHGVSFSTTDGRDAEWEFLKNEGIIINEFLLKLCICITKLRSKIAFLQM